jgi:thiosulfate/3-mercaptopyruvate sulfurtransferase
MDPDALTNGAWLASHLDDPGVRVIEVLYEPDVDDYSGGHIPGATSVFWKDLAWDDHDRQFITPQQMAARLGALGVGPETTLVLYSGRNHYAMYLYWILKEMAGHPDVRVLDGSRKRWTMDGRPLSTEVPTYAPASYPSPARYRDDSTRVFRDDVLANLGRTGRVLIDARSPDEYEGRRLKPGTGFDFGAERYGHIPGARNLHARDLVDPDDFTVKRPAELERLFRSVGAAPDQTTEVVAYCRLSHRANSLRFIARHVLGWQHIRVYDGSWTEWGSSVGMPIERDPAVIPPKGP